MALLLFAASAAAFLLWTVVLLRVRRTTLRLRRVRSGLDRPAPADGWPAVSVVVPAHDEAGVIESCVAALRGQDYPRLSMVFVLDRCTDATAELLRPHAAADPRITVIENESCPPDWAGKCHAAWLGAQRCDGDLLLFTDADTRFEPTLVRAAVACAEAGGCDLLSLLPRLTVRHRFERLVQPVASMTLMRMYPIERVDHPVSPRPFANGQFLLFRREAYEAVGGHAGVRGELLEDLAFARRLGESSRRVGLLLADDLFEVAMYESLGEFLRGWRRIFIEACHRKPWRMLKNALRAVVVGLLLPLAQAGLVVWAVMAFARGERAWPAAALALVLLGAAMQAATLCWVYRLQGAPRRGIVAFPLGSLAVAWTLLRGAWDLWRRRPVRWGGKEYVLEPR